MSECNARMQPEGRSNPRGGFRNITCRAFYVSNVRTVILDIDGTLLASHDAHAFAFKEAAATLGVEADLNQIRHLIGKGSDKLIPEAFGFEAESEWGKKLDDLKGKIFRAQ